MERDGDRCRRRCWQEVRLYYTVLVFKSFLFMCNWIPAISSSNASSQAKKRHSSLLMNLAAILCTIISNTQSLCSCSEWMGCCDWQNLEQFLIDPPSSIWRLSYQIFGKTTRTLPHWSTIWEEINIVIHIWNVKLYEGQVTIIGSATWRSRFF